MKFTVYDIFRSFIFFQDILAFTKIQLNHGRKSWGDGGIYPPNNLGSSPPIFLISVLHRSSPIENMQNSIESTIFSIKYPKFSPAAHI